MTQKPARICFGLTEEMDRESFTLFLQLAGNPDLAKTLSERMTLEQIDQFVDAFTHLLKEHLSEKEYHSLFLQS